MILQLKESSNIEYSNMLHTYSLFNRLGTQVLNYTLRIWTWSMHYSTTKHSELICIPWLKHGIYPWSRTIIYIVDYEIWVLAANDLNFDVDNTVPVTITCDDGVTTITEVFNLTIFDQVGIYILV